MHEKIFASGHAGCTGCKSAFPLSWFITRGAVKINGNDFCSQKCADNFGKRPSANIPELFRKAALG